MKEKMELAKEAQEQYQREKEHVNQIVLRILEEDQKYIDLIKKKICCMINKIVNIFV